MIDFEIGDRVEAIASYPNGSDCICKGDTGTICDLFDGEVGVAWDFEFEDGHDCSGACKYGHGWYVFPDEIRLCEDETIEIQEDSFMQMLANAE